VGVVDQAIEYGVGVFMPTVDGKLRSDDRGAAAVSLLEDFEQIVTSGGVERLQAPIVEDEKIGAAEERRMRGWRPSPRAGVRSSKSFGTR
jgi:hypothetical protein